MTDSLETAALPPCPDDTLFTREALAVARGIGRLFARNDIWCLPEMPLRNGRRADLMGIDAKGRVVIVEIKVARADLLGDAKWTEYLDHCDRFYWGLAPHLDRAGSRPRRSCRSLAASSSPTAMMQRSCARRPAFHSPRRGARSRSSGSPALRCAGRSWPATPPAPPGARARAERPQGRYGVTTARARSTQACFSPTGAT